MTREERLARVAHEALEEWWYERYGIIWEACHPAHKESTLVMVRAVLAVLEREKQQAEDEFMAKLKAPFTPEERKRMEEME